MEHGAKHKFHTSYIPKSKHLNFCPPRKTTCLLTSDTSRATFSRTCTGMTRVYRSGRRIQTGDFGHAGAHAVSFAQALDQGIHKELWDFKWKIIQVQDGILNLWINWINIICIGLRSTPSPINKQGFYWSRWLFYSRLGEFWHAKGLIQEMLMTLQCLHNLQMALPHQMWIFLQAAAEKEPVYFC